MIIQANVPSPQRCWGPDDPPRAVRQQARAAARVIAANASTLVGSTSWDDGEGAAHGHHLPVTAYTSYRVNESPQTELNITVLPSHDDVACGSEK
jgi:hypothetical protein